MRPLLAHIYEPHRVSYPCWVQPKLNGIRALYQGGRFQSRDELPFPIGLLDHLSKPLREIFGDNVILDGELYKHGWPLQRINAAVTPVRQQPTEDTLQVEYHVFDVVDFGQPFSTRIEQVRGRGLIRTVFCGTENLANELYAQFVAEGYEGMMYRLGDCPYTMPKQTHTSFPLRNHPSGRTAFLSDKNNRCWHLLKRKDWHDDEFEFLALRATVGEKGKRGFIMTLRSKSRTKPTFDVGSGLTETELDHYLENPPTGRLVKVKYLVLSVDQIPLNPTILAIL